MADLQSRSSEGSACPLLSQMLFPKCLAYFFKLPYTANQQSLQIDLHLPNAAWTPGAGGAQAGFADARRITRKCRVRDGLSNDRGSGGVPRMPPGNLVDLRLLRLSPRKTSTGGCSLLPALQPRGFDVFMRSIETVVDLLRWLASPGVPTLQAAEIARRNEKCALRDSRLSRCFGQSKAAKFRASGRRFYGVRRHRPNPATTMKPPRCERNAHMSSSWRAVAGNADFRPAGMVLPPARIPERGIHPVERRRERLISPSGNAVDLVAGVSGRHRKCVSPGPAQSGAVVRLHRNRWACAFRRASGFTSAERCSRHPGC